MSKLKVSSNTRVPQTTPRGAPDSIDVYFKSANVLVDPGFENFVAGTGGWYYRTRGTGSNDYIIPYVDTINCLSDLTYPTACLTGSFPTWAQVSGPYTGLSRSEDQAWKVTTWDSHQGQYHAVWWQTFNGGIPPGELCALNPYLSGPFSARAEPGDKVDLSGYAKRGADDTDTPAIIPVIRYYTAADVLIKSVTGTETDLTTSYAQYSVDGGNAPAGTVYIRASFLFTGGTTSWSTVSLDTCALGVL